VRHRLVTILLGAAWLLAWLPLAAADEPPKPPARPSSLDQQLLDGLDRELLQGLPAGAKPAADAGKPAASGAAPVTSDNPLAVIAERMRQVESRLAKQDTSPETQAVQKQIQAELTQLLEQARRQQGSGQNKPGGPGSGNKPAGAGSGNPTPAPPRESTNRIEQGNKEAVETTDVKDLLRRIWGELPEKLRDQMQASLSEQFLPKYERLIEEYYKRLAEERPAGP
jgi:hypothetical protein